MILPCSKKNSYLIFSVLLITVVLHFAACKKVSGTETAVPDPPDFTTKILSSVSGYVNVGEGAVVEAGGVIAITDKSGYFEIHNALVVKNAATVTITKNGFVKSILTYLASPDKEDFFRIYLRQKIVRDINTDGGIFLGSPIPLNELVNAATNAPYSDKVNLTAEGYDPSVYYDNIVGDRRALDSNGAIKLLLIFYTDVLELAGTSGEKLQLAKGKKAMLNFPVSDRFSIPEIIPMWYFDETLGLWKQEGYAKKQGTNYVGQVSHFSYWCIGIPEDFIHYSCTIKDSSGRIPQNIFITISRNSDYPSYTNVNINSKGNADWFMPVNSKSQLGIGITNSFCCNGLLSKDIIAGTKDISLGDIIPEVSHLAKVFGRALDCNNSPVKNGFIIVYFGGWSYHVPVLSDGTFSINFFLAKVNNQEIKEPIYLTAIDEASNKQGIVSQFQIVEVDNDLGNISSCTETGQFINYTVNGKKFIYSNPPGLVGAYYPPGTSFIEIGGGPVIGGGIVFDLDITNIGLATKQNIFDIRSNETGNGDYYTTSGILATITEYGNPGQFISGNFAGVLNGSRPDTIYNINCNFRVKRP